VQMPLDNLLELNADVQEKNELIAESKKEDMVDQDIMEYSTLHADQDVDDDVIKSGGAILEAFAENDSNFKKIAA